jgi:hypothetical protein
LKTSVFGFLLLSALWASSEQLASAQDVSPMALARVSLGDCLAAQEVPEPLLSLVNSGQLATFEKQFLTYLQQGGYKGWCVDKRIRDTGPFKEGVYYGTHPAVRVYYSPKLMQWLLSGRKGTIPDGTTIIKEQFPPPAARYAGTPIASLPKAADWTVMIRDSKTTKDGWFWGEWFNGMTFDDDQFPFAYPTAGYGLYCLRCHSVSTTQGTFSSLRNIAGFAGQPMVYPDDGSWRGTTATSAMHGRQTSVGLMNVPPPADPNFLRTFFSIPGVSPDQVQKLPSETYDSIPQPGTGPGSYISSSECMSCHGALGNTSPFGPVMFIGSQPPPKDPAVTAGANVSGYTEWRWSPMGLAGRDPVFFSQLENELSILKTLPGINNDLFIMQLRNGCLTCHGAMGKRQLDIDKGGSGGDFQLSYLQNTDRTDPNFKYGALARDGISCTICHRIVPDQAPPGVNPLQHFLANSITGLFPVTGPTTIFGPFQDNAISPLAMKNGLGMTPTNSTYLPSSRMCGTCHTIDLPVADSGKLALHSIEQGTYLEWLNSGYQTEFGTPGPLAKNCQSCHMPGTFHNESKGIPEIDLKQKVAIIEDQTYPVSDNLAPPDQINVRVRNNYSRHTFLGLNVFLLNIFNQFDDVLGIRKTDYMSGSTTVVQETIDNFTQQAQQETARLDVSATAGLVQNLVPQVITAKVKVTNLVGHRFPSGVGFRRVFLEVAVVQTDAGKQNVLWVSGATNSLGLILGSDGQPLPSEFFADYKDSSGNTKQAFQPHYQVITSPDQVQIYEELVQNANGRFTTSFIRRDDTVKDNRLMPFGWSKTGPDPASLNGRFLKATMPDGEAVDDPDYQNGLGADNIIYQITLPPNTDLAKCTVRVTLYNQSIPPYFLRDRFSGVPDGDATKRLYYVTSRLQLAGTGVENWKMKLTSASSIIRSAAQR